MNETERNIAGSYKLVISQQTLAELVTAFFSHFVIFKPFLTFSMTSGAIQTENT